MDIMRPMKRIKRAVDELISMRLITPDELNKKGYKNMYESYFYGNSALKKESLMIQTSFYSYIYLTAGRYFYGKNRFAEAKALFKKGLKYVPENQELQKMYQWASEDLNDR